MRFRLAYTEQITNLFTLTSIPEHSTPADSALPVTESRSFPIRGNDPAPLNLRSLELLWWAVRVNVTGCHYSALSHGPRSGGDSSYNTHSPLLNELLVTAGTAPTPDE